MSLKERVKDKFVMQSGIENNSKTTKSRKRSRVEKYDTKGKQTAKVLSLGGSKLENAKLQQVQVSAQRN